MNLKIKSNQFNLLYSLLTILIYNPTLYRVAWSIIPSWGFVIAIYLLAFCALNIILSILFVTPKTSKVIGIFLCLGNTVALYFMNTYHILIDRVMMLNVIHTNVYEAGDLLHWKLFAYIISLGILPSWLIHKTKIEYSPLKSEIKRRISIIGMSLAIAAIIILPNIQKSHQIYKGHKELRYALVPSNYIGAGIGILKMYKEVFAPYQMIAEDAKFTPYWNNHKKMLIVLVIGESARAKNFSLNGYERDTNAPLTPYLKDIINYPDFYACGTSTAISVSCMLSKDSQKDFKAGSELNTANIADVLQNNGYHSLWRDNNTSCMDNCRFIETEAPCNGKFCLDDVLLKNFKDKIRSINQNAFVILHQRGSHGPDYYTRFPQDSTPPYQPICTNVELKECDTQALINAYDNSIYETSNFLKDTIEDLKSLSDEYNTVLIFSSDHGESLGENGIYLHGYPYHQAPKEQKHIPTLIWMPKDTAKALKIDMSCLKREAKKRHSHDNIFHSILGLSGISTQEYNKELDIFANCRQ